MIKIDLIVYILDEIEIQQNQGSYELWDWDYLKQAFATHIMVDTGLNKIKDSLGKTDSKKVIIEEFLSLISVFNFPISLSRDVEIEV